MSFRFPRQDVRAKQNNVEPPHEAESYESRAGASGPASCVAGCSFGVGRGVEGAPKKEKEAAESAEEVELLVTFPSVHHALKLERMIKTCACGQDGSGRSVDLMPVPRRISSSCGLAASVCVTMGAGSTSGNGVARLGSPGTVCRSLVEELKAAGVEYQGIYLPLPGGEFQLLTDGEEAGM
ncbi:MAG TPA: DUF3343 domain-containing protein [Bacillota bacterium]|jgi:hypothetical protein|nr:DUF3343 domain-containing protein [Bacillota bacterium]HOK70219.1 DUF3343 domain-containing protein [Bacillota bacterium]HQD79753.1 DUF3343 domain-containing protein [Bacillota bacterium]